MPSTAPELRRRKAALAKLPEEQRRCWVLKEFNDQSYEEIALN